MSFYEGMSHVRKRRPIVFPNVGFQRQLMDFERMLRTKKSFDLPANKEKIINMTPNKASPQKLLQAVSHEMERQKPH